MGMECQYFKNYTAVLQLCTSFSLNDFKTLKLASYPLLFYLDIPVSLIKDHLDKLSVLESIQKVGIETVEVGLNADTLHHQVLRHPGHKLLLHCLF